MARTRAGHGGFTLVELLVALTLLAIVGLMAWRGLDHAIAQRSRIDREMGALNDIIRTLAQLDRDMAQRVPDMVVPLAASRASALPGSLEIALAPDGNAALTILRAAPDDGRGLRVQRIRWLLANGVLVREASAPTFTLPVTRTASSLQLIDAVRGVSARLMIDGAWVPAGSSGAGRSARATGIELVIDRGNERYVRVFAL